MSANCVRFEGVSGACACGKNPISFFHPAIHYFTISFLEFRDFVFPIIQADPTSFYANHQIFCLSSIHEAFGICLLEAGAQGLPTVAACVGGVPEVIRDGATGLLVPPRDPEAMANALLHLIDNPALRRQMGRAAAAHVRENFPVERMTGQYKNLYTN
jgi:glycosyltransferase involved in cell wall biosynthesis